MTDAAITHRVRGGRLHRTLVDLAAILGERSLRKAVERRVLRVTHAQLEREPDAIVAAIRRLLSAEME